MKRVSRSGRCLNFAFEFLSQQESAVGGRRLLFLPAAAWLLLFGLIPASTVSAQTFGGVLSGTAATLPMPAGEQSDPWGVAVDGSGNLYITDYSNNQVLMETPSDGGYTESAIITGLNSPEGIAVDASGNLYVADTGNVRVVKETLAGGSYTASVIASATNGLVTPVAVAVDGAGNVYVADLGSSGVSGTGAVYKETAQGNSYTQSTVAGSLNQASSVVVDGSGNVYIADSGNNRILLEAPAAGTFTQSVIFSGLSDPSTLALDPAGNLYFAVQGNGSSGTSQLYRATVSGGSYTQTLLGSGLSSVFGLAADSSGNLYVGNNSFSWMVKETPGGSGALAVSGVGSRAQLTGIYTFSSASTLGAIAVSTQGNSGLDFSDAHSGTCTVGHNYYPGDNCTVQVNFAPLASGPRYGGIVLLDNSSDVIGTAWLQGTAIAPQVIFTSGTPSILPAGALNYPFGMAADASGTLYIANTDGDTVLKETLVGGSYSESTVGTGLSGPGGVAVDGAGNVYIADSENGRVLKETVIGGSYAQSEILVGMPDVSDVAVDGEGNLYVADPDNNQIWKEVPNSSGGYVQSAVGSGLFQPYAVAVDAVGDVYIADTNNNRVLIETPSAGSYVQNVVAGDSSISIDPNGVAVDGNLNVYIADGNGRVLKETPSGGTYSETVLSGADAEPWGIAVDGAGNVYVVEAIDTVGDTINEVVKLDYADAPSVSFGSNEGGGSAQTLAIENFGNAPLHFPAPSSGTNPSISANFTLTSNQSGDCPAVGSGASAGQLAANTSCLLTMSFTPDPLLNGSVNGQLVLKDDALNAGAPAYVTQSIGLTGTATPTYSLAALVSPAPGSTLSGSSVTFSWTAGSGLTGYGLHIGTRAGGNDVYNSGLFTTTSASINNLPTNGTTLYVQLYSLAYGVWHSTSYTFTEAPPTAALVSPAPGSTLSGSSVTFSWTAGSGVTGYGVHIGTTAGGNDLYNSGMLTTTSLTVNNIPTTGKTLYVLLYSLINGVWRSTSYTFTEAPPTAVLVSPAPGSTLSGSSVTFGWTPGSGVTGYGLHIGTTAGGNDVYNSGMLTTTSLTVNNIPTTGKTLYVLLYSLINGVWRSTSYTFTEAPPTAALVSPAPGSTLSGSSVTFGWTTGSGVTGYGLHIGTTAGGNDVYNSGLFTTTSATINNLPTNGTTLYVQLYSLINGVWRSISYTFTEAPSTGAL